MNMLTRSLLTYSWASQWGKGIREPLAPSRGSQTLLGRPAGLWARSLALTAGTEWSLVSQSERAIKQFSSSPFTSLLDHISSVLIPWNHLCMAGWASLVSADPQLPVGQWTHLFLTSWLWRTVVRSHCDPHALRGSQNAKQSGSFKVCPSPSSGIGWQEPRRIIYISEWKSCYSSPGWQIKEGDATYHFFLP